MSSRRLVGLHVCSLALALGASGCCGPQSYALVGEEARMSPMDIKVGVAGSAYVLTFVAPTTGWVVTKDREAVTEETPRVFVSLAAPGADAITAAMLVEHRVETEIPACGAMEVFVRSATEGAEEEFGEYERAPLPEVE